LTPDFAQGPTIALSTTRDQQTLAIDHGDAGLASGGDGGR
jgi:hypothetical protein